MLKRARRRFWVICHWLWAWDFSFLLLSWLSWCRDSTPGDLLKHNYCQWRHPAQGHSAVLSNNNSQDDSGYHFNCLHTTAIIRSFMFPLFIKKKTPLKKKTPYSVCPSGCRGSPSLPGDKTSSFVFIISPPPPAPAPVITNLATHIVLLQVLKYKIPFNNQHFNNH